MICKECKGEDWETITKSNIIKKDVITGLPQFLFQCRGCKRVVMIDIQATYDKKREI